MKLYTAKQVNPEFQNPHFEPTEDYLSQHIAIFGNSRMKEYIPENIRKVVSALYDGLIFYLQEDYGVHGAIDEICELFPRIAGRRTIGEYTGNERTSLYTYFSQFRIGKDDVAYTAAKILSIQYGYKWRSVTLRGCCQGDWQECVYAEPYYDEDELEKIESLYFNTGTEYEIVKNGSDDSSDILYLYTTSWDTAKKKKEIADELGCQPDEIEMLDISHYVTIPQYVVVD